MALTVIERKLLEGARTLIQDGSQTYICYALDKVRVIPYDPHKLISARSRLCDYISESLQGHGTLGSYLSSTNDQLFYPTDDLQRKARVQWINWMLGEPVEFDAKAKREIATYMRKKS
jgi:hypothetical protein